jgi:hypothetical protein
MLENMKVSELINIVKLLQNSNPENCNKKEDMRYVIVRTYSAGVFSGNIESKNGKEIILRNARRLWKWSGAASLSQLAVDGVKDPENCMFPCEVDKIEILEAIEILNCTEKSKKSIQGVKVWEK